MPAIARSSYRLESATSTTRPISAGPGVRCNRGSSLARRNDRAPVCVLAGEPDRLRPADVPPGGDDSPERVVAQVVGRAMRIVLGHLGHQDPGDEMDTITASEDAFVNHPFVLLERQPVGRRRYPLRARGLCRRCDRGHRWLPPPGRPEPATRHGSIITPPPRRRTRPGPAPPAGRSACSPEDPAPAGDPQTNVSRSDRDARRSSGLPRDHRGGPSRRSRQRGRERPRRPAPPGLPASPP